MASLNELSKNCVKENARYRLSIEIIAPVLGYIPKNFDFVNYFVRTIKTSLRDHMNQNVGQITRSESHFVE